MLSTKPIGNIDEAQHYFFSNDNYYAKEDGLEKERSEWWGKGAKALNLSGFVEARQFTELLKGHLPDGQQLGKKVDQDIEHRPGFDLTFSAPKSLSLLALLGGDERILSAVQRATDNALSLIERTCAQARVTRQGITTYENTHNLVVAKFLHDISREADPQLHVHCVVMNMTQRSDGKWRSLASRPGDYGADVPSEVNGFLERVRHHKLYYGAIFRAELAYEIKQLGYEIVKTGKYGFFEIEGISQVLIDLYSQRRKQIETYLQEHGFSSAKAAAVATIKTRKANPTINRETLRELWQMRGESKGIDAFQEAKHVVDKARTLQPVLEQPDALAITAVKEAAKEAIHYAISHLSETQIAIHDVQLMGLAMQYVIGEKVQLNMLIDALNEVQKNGELILLPSQHNERYFTTKQLLHYEYEIVAAIHKQIEPGKPIVSQPAMDTFLAKQTHLTAEQQTAIRTIFSSDYQINLLDGPTGTGKTYLLKPMMELARENGYRSILLTPSKEGSMDLKKQLRSTPTSLREWIKSLFDKNEYDTVSRFIKTQEKLINTHRVSPHPSMIFVDDATLLSSRQMRDLTYIAEKTHRYLILNGDQKTSLAWQSGTPYTQMLAKGASAAHLTTNVRQQAPHIKEAINDTLQHHLDKAFEKVGHHILSIEDKEERLRAMAVHYAALDTKEQEKTLVLMPTKAQCEEMNHAIHDALKKENKIAQTGIEVTVLLPKSFSEAQYQRANHYEKGQWVRFNENFVSLKIQCGEYLQILDLQPTQNLILLVNRKGDKINWNPQKVGGRPGVVEVFAAKTRELVVGETLCWKRSHKMLDIHTGEKLKIDGIKHQQLILSRSNHKQIKVDIREPQMQHFDYGYAATPLQKHYLSINNSIAYQHSYSRQSHQRLFYKELSQAKNNIWIYTENKEALLKNLQKHTGNKSTAIDALISESEELKKNATAPLSDYLLLLEKAVASAIEHSQQNLSPTQKVQTPESLAKEAVQYALAHLSEREAAFEHKRVMEVALTQVLGEARPDTIQQAIVQAEKEGNLIRGVYSKEGTRWTTPEAIAMERDILKEAKREAGQLKPIADANVVEDYLLKIKPKQEHAVALREICTNTDRNLVVQGLAGTMKTTMLMYLEPFLKAQNHELLCLAPTHAAVKELVNRGLKAQTLDSFLAENIKFGKDVSIHHDKLVIALDENSMSSNRRILEILQLIQARKIRGTYIGDKGQHTAIEAGKPHALLINHIKTVYLTDIVRQKDATLLKAVKESYRGDFKAAFATLKDSIIEIGKESVGGKTVDNDLKRQEAFRDDYLSRNPKLRSQILASTLSNESREKLNELTREGLKEKGELSGDTLNTTILVSRDMTEIEKTRASNYYRGDKIRFGYYDPTLQVTKGSYLTIQEINIKENYLVLGKDNGQIARWQPPALNNTKRVGIEAYSPQAREVMAGNFIRWTRSDKNLGLFSPHIAQVICVSQDHLQLRATKLTQEGVILIGDPFQIEPHQPKYQHWEYGYVLTGYSSQGKTTKENIALFESYRKNLATQRAFIVMLTRAEYKATIYTDDKAKLLEQILKNPGDKTSALETIGEWQEINSDKQFQSIVKEHVKTSQGSKKVKENPQQHSFSYGISNAKDSTPAQSAKSFYDAEQITTLLHENTEFIVEKLLGEPKRRAGNQYHYGSHKGSLKVTLTGDKRGFWYDFETGEGGNLLQLIAKQCGLELKNKEEFKKALEQAAQWVGVSESVRVSQSGAKFKTQHTKTHAEKSKELTEEQKKSIHYARKLVQESQPLEGTLAERYLRQHRGIHLDNYPDNFRFHPAIYSGFNKAAHPALLVIAKDAQGQTQAVQAIFLDKKTANKAEVEVVKQTWGPSSLYSVDINPNAKESGVTLAAEGPETGLSIHAAFPKEHIKILLGKSNFGNMDPATSRKNVVFCLDNDGNDPQKEKEIHVAVEKFTVRGKNEKVLWMAKPEDVKDYNDLLKNHGASAIKENINKAIPYSYFHDKNKSPVTLKSEIFDQVKSSEITAIIKEKAHLVLTDKNSMIDLSAIDIHKLPYRPSQIDDQVLKAAATLSQQTIVPSQDMLDKSTPSSITHEQVERREISISSQEIKQKSIGKETEKEPEL